MTYVREGNKAAGLIETETFFCSKLTYRLSDFLDELDMATRNFALYV